MNCRELLAIILETGLYLCRDHDDDKEWICYGETLKTDQNLENEEHPLLRIHEHPTPQES